MTIIKYLVLLFFSILIFNSTFAAEYTVPRAAYSVYAEDLDLDGDKDIVVGHNYNSQTEWSGVSILQNNGQGVFTLIDSVFLYGWQPDVQIKNVSLNEYPEIIAKKEDSQEENEYIAVINNFNFDDISYFSLNSYEGVGMLTSGDIDADNDIDIIVASNNGRFWGVLYNDGTGQFLAPQYHAVTGYYPTDIACGNLNEDNRDDVVVSGQEVEIYFSYASGFECYALGDHELSVRIADVDNDGDNDVVGLTDLYLIGYTGITIYENLGSNNFAEHDQILFQPSLSHFEISDVNNDTLPDVVCTGRDDGIYILYNEGNFNLSVPRYFTVVNYGEFSRKSFCADLDGNGYDDIITIRYLHAVLPANFNILFNDGTGNFVEQPPSGIVEDEVQVIKGFKLYQNYPNPFNQETIISYYLNKPTHVELSIYTVSGQLVKTLTNEQQKGGLQSVRWDGTNEKGKKVSSGVYLYTLRVGENIVSKKMLLVR